LCEAIRTAFPDACDQTLRLLDAPQTPPVRVIVSSLVNELDAVAGNGGHSGNGGRSAQGLILALDDYHTITEPAIHEMISSLIAYLPQGMHVALATRADPRLPLVGLRARRKMTEVRSLDLRFNSEEARAFLEETVGRELSPETIRLLENKTEGWVVGLRLAALSLRNLADDEAFVQGFKGTGSAAVVDYLAREVLAHQSPEIQDFALRTAILDRFCAPLCEMVTQVSARKSQEMLEWIAGANLFLVPLDEQGRWFRYHHLFRDLLRLELRQQYSAADITGLHARTGAWFAQNGLLDEALDHLMTANDIAASANLVARHRYALMNHTRWQRLDRYLNQFSPDILDHYPDLLMLQTWLLYYRGRWAELPAALQRLEAALTQASLPPEEVDHLQGEISALRSLLFYHAFDPENALASAQQALEKTPRELWIVRILARLILAGVLQMRGDSSQAYAAIYRGVEEEETQSDAFRATLMMTVCYVHWVEADLQGMAQAANQCITFCQQADVPNIQNYGRYHLGKACYQQNDLTAAARHFATVVQQPYLNYGDCFAHGACGLALIHQAQGRPDEARGVLEAASTLMLETGNTTLLPVIQAFQAEIALRQGQIATAGQWAAYFDPVPPLSPMVELFSPHLTLVKVWLAQDTPSSRRQAADLLDKAREFVESTHNTRFLIEVLAIQALLFEAEGNEAAALEALERAITLAEPGGFIRLFVDLGPPLDRLLDRLRWQGVAPEYITQILIALETMDGADTEIRRRTTEPASGPSSPLVEALTPRELEVLALLARHLTNKEIAERLVISPETVKTHTLSIYRKLDVRKRQQAVARAKEWGVL
jgi:LuxR family maltose regulon positive regulatory protein